MNKINEVKTKLMKGMAWHLIIFSLSTCTPLKRDHTSNLESFSELADCDKTSSSDCPKGHSFFDEIAYDLEGDKVKMNLPFPFTRLLEKIKNKTNHQGTGVLIPSGRSLQAIAAGTDFFKFPRVVVSFPRQQQSSIEGLPLRDKLFLGYSESAQQIEIISYNATMNRYEFQVVTDYSDKTVPKLHYAPRRLCTKCHQNEGPIFSKADWEETNANGALAHRLKEFHGSDYQGIPTRQASERAYDDDHVFESFQVDESTDRAIENILIWPNLAKVLCEGKDVSCLKGIQIAMIANELELEPSIYLTQLESIADKKPWLKKWKAGIKVVNDADIENRQATSDMYLTESDKRIAAKMRPPYISYNPKDPDFQKKLELSRELGRKRLDFILRANRVMPDFARVDRPRSLRKETWQLVEQGISIDAPTPNQALTEQRLPPALKFRKTLSTTVRSKLSQLCSSNCSNLFNKIMQSKSASLDASQLAKEILGGNENKKVSTYPKKLLSFDEEKAVVGKSLVQKYCGRCHAHAGQEGPSFLEQVKNAQDLKKVSPLLCQRLHHEKLDQELWMPPPNAKPASGQKLNEYHFLQQHPEEWRDLLNYLECP